MLKPNDIEMLQGENSRYAVVIGVAKRARDIAEEMQGNKEVEKSLEKPVSIAVNELKEGKYKLICGDVE